MVTDPAPLTLRQIGVMARCASRELGSGLRDVSREVAHWRAHASEIDDLPTRTRVLHDLRAKRSYVNGSAHFSTLVTRRAPRVTRLLAAFQILANYLDAVSERDAARTGGCPRLWTSMLRDAVDLGHLPDPDLYAAVGPEGQYLRALVDACRMQCAALPGYREAHPIFIREARLAATLDLEHDPCRASRDHRLRTLIDQEIGTEHELAWWELAAGTSSALTVTVALALAASTAATPVDIERAVGAYRYVAALAALLDNYVDQERDRQSGAHNYILERGWEDGPTSRLCWLIARTHAEVQCLRDARRHTLLVANMTAMFLTSDEAREPSRQPDTARLLRASGLTTRVLVPALRAWRLTHRQRGG